MELEELSRLRELENRALEDLQDAARELLVHIADCDCGHTIWANNLANLIDDRPERQAHP
jgi:hypothetical protein